VSAATGKVYGVRTIAAGNTMRVVVTATNLAGSTTATSAPTGLVAGNATPPPVTHRNHAPTIAYLSLRRVGFRVYARFRLCDDAAKAVTVIERDVMPGRLGYVRRFSVVPVPCGTHARGRHLLGRVGHPGRGPSSPP